MAFWWESSAITKGLARLEQSAFECSPQLKGGLSGKLLHQLLHGLGRLLVERKVASELKNWGADGIYFAIRENLKTTAAKVGNPDTIARGEISAFLVHEGIIPGVMQPIRATARAQQLPLVGIAIMAMVVPPRCIRLARQPILK